MQIADKRVSSNSAVTVINALALKPVLMEVVIRPFENTRTSIRNAKYWAELTECLETKETKR